VVAEAAPSEFDLELESERARWLRRRFLWFCVANVCMELALLFGFYNDVHGSPRMAATLNYVRALVIGGGYIVAFVYVLRRKSMALGAVLSLALWITAIFHCLAIALLRANVDLNRVAWNDLDDRLPPGALLAVLSPYFFLVRYAIACVLIPWTLREAVKPAAAILVVNAVVIVSDMLFTLRGEARGIALFHLIISPLFAAPGLFVCWLRQSRFRKRFQITFEAISFRKLQKELAGARRLHEATLPPRDGFATGPVRLAYAYEPMRQIGGDLLYVHPPDDPSAATLWVALVDVNGHGIPAALMANRLIGEIQRLFAEHPGATPHFLLARLNRYVFLTMARAGVYATAIVCRIDTQAGTLQYANAGHPPAFLCRKSDGAIVRLDSDTYLLGVRDDEDYCRDCNTVPFEPGDALLAYTDGATEARSLRGGDMLGIEGLMRMLSSITVHQRNPATWPEHLLRHVTQHRRGPPADDTLLLAVYRT
jgi:serine phosphatase RsbU (regulator of sigma subunit)